ncbi:TetR/AcrR family transcriptional regulator [Priestia megaterium]|nr:TetR/AcrR family transcriptional regulator [Priestia megaterium]
MSPRIGLDLPTILQKAIELIDQHGHDQLTLGKLAKELNIRTPSLYNHVDGLDGLKQQLAIHGLKKLYHAMAQAVIGRSGDNAIRLLSNAYVQFARTHPGLYEAIFQFSDPHDSELQQAQHTVVQLVMQVLNEYGLEEEMALHMVRGLRSILHGFTSIEQMGGFQMPLEIDKSLTILIDTFIQGIHSLIEQEGK